MKNCRYRLVLRLHSRAWRERYGEEVRDLSDELLAAGELTWLRLALGLTTSGLLERTASMLRAGRRRPFASLALGFGLSGVAIGIVAVVDFGGTAQVAANPVWWPGTTPAQRGAMDLTGVSCASETYCVAVGFDVRPTSPRAGVWNGRVWTAQQAAEPAGARAAELAVRVVRLREGLHSRRRLHQHRARAVQPGRALERPALGGRERPRTSDRGCRRGSSPVGRLVRLPKLVHGVGISGDNTRWWTVAESWNGKRWVAEATPDRAGQPATVNNYEAAVSCPTPVDCGAVWNYTATGTHSSPLTEAWNGNRWVVESTTDPPGVTSGNHLSGVSCPRKAECTGVGESAGSDLSPIPLVEASTRTSWTIESTPVTRAGSVLEAVSCASGASCVAVGQYLYLPDNSVPSSPLAEEWNGKRWIVDSPHLANGNLDAVSCVTKSYCIAVGSFDSGGRVVGPTLAEEWKGARWTKLATLTEAG